MTLTHCVERNEHGWLAQTTTKYSMPLAQLAIHPFNAKVYGDEKPSQELIESMRKVGQLEPILVARVGRSRNAHQPLGAYTYKTDPVQYYILSGNRRYHAAKKLGWTEVDVRCIRGDNPTQLEIEQIIIEANRQRIKTAEQKAREFKELKRIESLLAKERQGARTDIKANVPESPNPSASRGRQRSHEYMAELARYFNALRRAKVSPTKGGFHILDSSTNKRIPDIDSNVISAQLAGDLGGSCSNGEGVDVVFTSKIEALRDLKQVREVIYGRVDNHTDQDLATATLRCCKIDFPNLKDLQKHRQKAHSQKASGGNFRSTEPPKKDFGQARDKAAAAVGLKPRTADNLAKLVDAADAGNTAARSALDGVNTGTKSVAAALRETRPKPAPDPHAAAKQAAAIALASVLTGLFKKGTTDVNRAGDNITFHVVLKNQSEEKIRKLAKFVEGL
jgi:hypothetical protein